MSRLFTSGAELKDLTAIGVTKIGTGTDTFDTGTVRSGGVAFKYDSTASNLAVGHKFSFTGALDVTYFARIAVRFPAFTASDQIFFFVTNANNGPRLLITSTGMIKLDDGLGLVGTSSAISVNTWHYLEVEWKTVTGGGTTGTVKAKLDGTQFASKTTSNLGTAGATAINWGWPFVSPGASKVVFVDDVCLNDDTGTDQNTYPGDGKIVLLLPESDNARGANWTGGAGGTTNLWDAVDNTPPVGTATETDTTQIEHSGGANNSYDANLTTYTAAGVGGSDTITLAQLVAIHGEDVATGTKLLAFSMVSNPAISSSGNVTAGNDAGALGTYPSLWTVHRGTVTYAPTVTVGTAPVMRVNRPETTSRVASVCFMGLLVEYVPVVGGAALDGTIAAAATLTAKAFAPLNATTSATGSMTAKAFTPLNAPAIAATASMTADLTAGPAGAALAGTIVAAATFTTATFTPLNAAISATATMAATTFTPVNATIAAAAALSADLTTGGGGGPAVFDSIGAAFQYANSTNVAPTVPATVNAGDFLACYISHRDAGVSISSFPTGWAYVPTQSGSINPVGTGTEDPCIMAAYKIADGSEGGTTPAFTLSAAGNGVAAIARYTGNDTSTPFDADAVSNVMGAASTAIPVPQLTTATNGALVIVFVGGDEEVTSADQFTSWPASLTERADMESGTSNVFLGVADAAMPTAGTFNGSNGTVTATSDTWATLDWALKPASGAAGAALSGTVIATALLTASVFTPVNAPAIAGLVTFTASAPTPLNAPVIAAVAGMTAKAPTPLNAVISAVSSMTAAAPAPLNATIAVAASLSAQTFTPLNATTAAVATVTAKSFSPLNATVIAAASMSAVAFTPLNATIAAAASITANLTAAPAGLAATINAIATFTASAPTPLNAPAIPAAASLTAAAFTPLNAAPIAAAATVSAKAFTPLNATIAAAASMSASLAGGAAQLNATIVVVATFTASAPTPLNAPTMTASAAMTAKAFSPVNAIIISAATASAKAPTPLNAQIAAFASLSGAFAPLLPQGDLTAIFILKPAMIANVVIRQPIAAAVSIESVIEAITLETEPLESTVELAQLIRALVEVS